MTGALARKTVGAVAVAVSLATCGGEQPTSFCMNTTKADLTPPDGTVLHPGQTFLFFAIIDYAVCGDGDFFITGSGMDFVPPNGGPHTRVSEGSGATSISTTVRVLAGVSAARVDVWLNGARVGRGFHTVASAHYPIVPE